MESGVHFPEKLNKSKIFCSVYNCNNQARRSPNHSFHYFPEARKTQVNYVNIFGGNELIDKRLLWERVLKMGKKVTPTMRVCSNHFVKEDFTLATRQDYLAGRRILNKTCIPSVNLPASRIEIPKLSDETIQSRQERLENKLNNIKLNAKEKVFDDCDNCYLNTENETATYEEEVAVENESSNFDPQNMITMDVGVQIKSGDIINTLYFQIFFKTDKDLSTVTGIQNFQLFDSIVAAVVIQAPNLTKTTGVQSIRERVLMTFIKLKQNLSYSFLSILFPTISARYCSDVVCNMLDILSAVLMPCIRFSSGDEILRNMPLCFTDYTDTRIILDCTEIEIQRPKKLCCQISTYSNYKGRYTIKFMTGVTPGGTISFVSRGYGGRSSDEAIFEQSLLLERLEKGAAIMVDRGFLIDELCSDYGIKLIRPPFLADQNQFSEHSAIQTSSIASARVHVERLNQRIKVFKILGSIMASCLVPKSEKIMTILCAVVNLSSPIFKDVNLFLHF